MKEKYPPIEAVERALSMMTSYQPSLTARSFPMMRDYKWEPPPIDFLKLNVDGIVFFDLEKASIGFIV